MEERQKLNSFSMDKALEATYTKCYQLLSLIGGDVKAIAARKAILDYASAVETFVTLNVSPQGVVVINQETQKPKPFTKEELGDATIAESYTFLNLVGPEVTCGALADVLVKYATAVEKLIMGVNARGFE